MNNIALQRLYDAGWTPDRKVDITPIEEAYASENMVIPDRLRDTFEAPPSDFFCKRSSEYGITKYWLFYCVFGLTNYMW